MLNILVIEDEPEHRIITRLVLERRLAEVNIMEVEDGLQAIEYMHGHGQYRNRNQHPLPDIILLDIRMPKVDGFEFLEEMERSALTADIPVIIVSTSTQEQEISRAFSLGAYAYITKPIDVDKLMEKISSASGAVG